MRYCGYDWPGQRSPNWKTQSSVQSALEPGSELSRRASGRACQSARRWPPAPINAIFHSRRLLFCPTGINMENYVAQIERSLLQSALGQTHGVQVKAADVLGIS